MFMSKKTIQLLFILVLVIFSDIFCIFIRIIVFHYWREIFFLLVAYSPYLLTSDQIKIIMNINYILFYAFVVFYDFILLVFFILLYFIFLCLNLFLFLISYFAVYVMLI